MKGRNETIKRRKSEGVDVLYEASFMIDPTQRPDRQSYRVTNEHIAGRQHRRYRSELELPIDQSLAEIDKNGIYDRLVEAMQERQGEYRPNRMILSITILKRPESAELVADLISLFLRFATRVPDGGNQAVYAVIKPSYRLELSPGFEGPQVKLLNKSVAPAGGHRYGEYEKTEQPAEVVGIVSEEIQEHPKQQFESVLKGLFAGLPSDPKARLDAVIALQRAFRKEAANSLRPAINELLKSPPPAFVDKQNLASDLNNALHELGLAARGDNITQPCSIVPKKSQGSKAGWLKLQTRKEPRQISKPSTSIGEIDLIEAVREEKFGRGR